MIGDLSPLERYAREVAETAVNWASQQSGGRILPWEQQGEAFQESLATPAMTHIALRHAMMKVPYPEVVQ